MLTTLVDHNIMHKRTLRNANEYYVRLTLVALVQGIQRGDWLEVYFAGGNQALVRW